MLLFVSEIRFASVLLCVSLCLIVFVLDVFVLCWFCYVCVDVMALCCVLCFRLFVYDVRVCYV